MKSSAMGGTVSNHGARYFRRSGCAIVNGLVHKMNAQLIPFTEEHYATAVESFLESGTGRNAATLCFGDASASITAV
jgi:uncharacterized protein with PIN domain